MFLSDRLTLDAPRRTADGYLAVRAKAARAGVQDYLGYEVDPKGERFKATDKVSVYRPESEVFDERSVGSFLMKPVTNDHPSVSVTADNWKTHAKGVVAKALRDGDHLAFDLVLMDADTIAAVDSGKRELSNGYGCELELGDGTAPDGTPFQATQKTIRGNHVAVVDRARAGPECRITDAAPCNPLPAELLGRLLNDGAPKMPHVLIIDGLQVPNVSDEAKAAIEKLQKQIADGATAQAAHDGVIAKKDAEIDDLKSKVLDAAALDALVAARSNLIATAKLIAADIKTDGLSDADIRKAAVVAKLGDAAVKDKPAAYIDARFDILAEDAAKDKKTDPVRDAISGGLRTVTDASNGASVRNLARNMQYN